MRLMAGLVAVVIVSICSLILAEGLIQRVWAEATAPDVYVLAPVYYHNYASSEFHPSTSALTYESLGLALFATSLPTSSEFRKAIDLPDGAEIRQIDWDVVDNDAADDMTLEFIVGGTNGATYFTYMNGTSGLAPSSSVQTVSMILSPVATVNNNNNLYYLRYPPRHYWPESCACARACEIYSSNHLFAERSDSIVHAGGCRTTFEKVPHRHFVFSIPKIFRRWTPRIRQQLMPSL